MKESIVICWLRRDLRLNDNAALYHALKNHERVLPLFIFDQDILEDLETTVDRRVEFIHAAITELQKELETFGSSLLVCYGYPLAIFRMLFQDYVITHVYANHDYEPYALERDRQIQELLRENRIGFSTYKDQVIFERDEVIKEDGTPYTIFTPYSKKWKSLLSSIYISSYEVGKYIDHLVKLSPQAIPTLQSMGFNAVDHPFPSKMLDSALIQHYSEQRNFPGLEGTSKLGIHLRFGTISIRALVKCAMELNETFLKELIWRDFYQMILWQFPKIGKGSAFKEAYDQIGWRRDEKEFQLWCEGKTGYPLVDAGMRELNATGFMHNRVRMVVASFLCKHLLIDWRWGEAYFAAKLLDFDFASNNGGWQWAAGSGCDAAPYFRIFNPTLQVKKFDPELVYLRKWIPEFESFDYPLPIVQHEFARKRCIEVYSKAVKLLAH